MIFNFAWRLSRLPGLALVAWPPQCLLCSLLAASMFLFGSFCAVAQQDAPARSVDEWKQALRNGELDSRRQAAIATREGNIELQRELVPVFIELLRHEQDGQIRLAVFDTVTDMGSSAAEAVPALMFAMLQDFGGRRDEERHQDYRAALALGSIGRPAVEGLRNLLSEERENIRAEAAMALGRIGPEAAPAIPELIMLLGDESPRVRTDVIKAIGNIGPAALEPLRAGTQNESVTVRAACIKSIGLVIRKSAADDTTKTALLDALNDQESPVRAAAIEAIASSNLLEEVHQESLLEKLDDPDKAVQAAVVNALSQRPDMLRDMEADLVELLTASDEGVAWHAAFLLQLQGRAAVDLLLTALEDEHSRVEQISRALALIGGRPLVDRLHTALADPRPRVRQGAALALGKIRPLSEDSVARLASGLSDSNRDVQAAFLTSIRSLGARARGSVPAVRNMLRDESPEIRRQVIDILLEAAPRDRQLIDEFIALVNDPDPLVQQHAIDAIRSSGPFGQPAIPVVIEKLRSRDDNVRRAAAEFISSYGRAAAQAVPDLIELLGHDDPAWRIKVIETIGGLGATAQSALPMLADLLQDDSPEMRSAALQALGNLQLGPDQIGPHLVQALHDEDSEVRGQAASIIRRFGRRGMIFIPDLILLTADEESGESVSRILQRFESNPTDPTSIERLVELLGHEHPKVRQMAIRFLGLAGAAAHDVLDRLQPLAQETNEAIRTEAITAIARIRGEQSEAD